MYRTMFLALALGFAGASVAQTTPPPIPGGGPFPGGPGFPPVVTQMVFDCPSGPGYLRMTWIGPNGHKGYRTPFIGSREECLEQAKVLREHRSTIAKPSIVAACTAEATYMVRFSINQYGQVVNLPHLYYEDKAECVKDATELNTKK